MVWARLSATTRSMTVPPAQPSAQFMISELPEGLLPRIRSGFDILSKMSESDRRSVVRKFLDSFERITDLDGNWLNAVVSVERGDASTLLTALSVAVAILSQASNGLEEFLTAGRDKLFGESAMAAAREVATIIAQDRSSTHPNDHTPHAKRRDFAGSRGVRRLGGLSV
jgi:hypothetical protein